MIILEKPTTGVNFGLQKGRGNKYETIQTQRATGQDLHFEFQFKVKAIENKEIDFSGPFVQGVRGERFVYIDIGKLADQKESPWDRRLKIPLRGITVEMAQQLYADPGLILQTAVPGVGRDGGPNCATVKPFKGWEVTRRTSMP